MTTRTNTELNAVINYAIANNAYTRESIIQCIRESERPLLNKALDCCLDEGTLDEVITYFIDNPHFYPEGQEQNNIHNHHVLVYKTILTCMYGAVDHNHLLPEQCNQPHQVYDHIFA
ncbi:hypothetical protein VBApiPXC38_96 [Acinetobacter phage VB_ApiP_XC38]|uniref:Uncharacterized protein n=1 Tax=Acinetobacter phage VB_ApiP_XC38 TaxID=2655002 RepID=A0A5P8PR75_9CAUD|nr:hypothetical protein KNU81_gp96 [Acinetobacter phage VB_ApiP_XC38]QFR59783.1 hypothetical protein VBApiPXC38_96 [Acinetobacter phage VB_ApiP_XC38]